MGAAIKCDTVSFSARPQVQSICQYWRLFFSAADHFRKLQDPSTVANRPVSSRPPVIVHCHLFSIPIYPVNKQLLEMINLLKSLSTTNRSWWSCNKYGRRRDGTNVFVFVFFNFFAFLNNNNNVIERWSCVAVIVSKIVDKEPRGPFLLFVTIIHVSIHILLLFFLHLGSSTA
jgi:hypothetical protein